MDQASNGNFVAEPDLNTDIKLDTSSTLMGQLEAKLQEYHQREEEQDPDLAYKHPELRAFLMGASMFKSDILDYVLSAARDRDTAIEPITLAEVGEAIRELRGFDFTAAINAPIVLNERHNIPSHDREALEATSGPLNVAFSDAYFLIWAYASGHTDAVKGGTGLPEVAVN